MHEYFYQQQHNKISLAYPPCSFVSLFLYSINYNVNYNVVIISDCDFLSKISLSLFNFKFSNFIFFCNIFLS